MSKLFSANGQLKELVRNPGQEPIVQSYTPKQKEIVQILANASLSELTGKLLKLTGLLDQDIGVCETDYTSNVSES